MEPPPTFPSELPEQCERLMRDAHARAVLVLGGEGEILGSAGAVGRLPDAAVDAVGDLAADVLRGAARHELQEGDDLVAEIDALQACAAAVGEHAVLVVLFDPSSTLALVRLRMRRARELILRSLEAG